MSNALNQKDKAWSGRFSEPVSELVQRYTASVSFDQRLALFDIQGSLAHAGMLASVGLLSAQDLADIQRGMAQIQQEIESGEFQWSIALEDVHLNIEKRNLRIMASLLLIWFGVSFGCGILFVDVLNEIQFFGWRLGFWFSQQGAIYVFVLLIFAYVALMNRLDRRFGLIKED